MPKYRLKWHGGRSAQVEIYSPPSSGAAPRYFLRYSAPLRPSLRTVQECLAATPALNLVDIGLVNVVAGLRGANGSSVPPGAAPAVGGVLTPGEPVPTPALAPKPIPPQLVDAGSSLFQFILNSPAEVDLRAGNMFLELGTDEAVVNYPWELMFDDEDFTCLKHYVGRYVNTTRIGSPRMQISNPVSADWDKIHILIVSVPGPPGAPFLVGARDETDALRNLFDTMPYISYRLLAGHEATVGNVRNEMRSGRYQILHFCGHASFDEADARNSALLLHDFQFAAGMVITNLRSVVLSVVNACQTAKQGASVTGELNNFSLGRAFMEAESYLLGSRWKLSDKAAPKFAVSFYKALLKDWKPIGEAVQIARKVCLGRLPEDPECKGALPATDIGWASYVYYGDPRLAFEEIA
jgi:CHAT domain-containing protein